MKAIKKITTTGYRTSEKEVFYIDSIDQCPVCLHKCRPVIVGTRAEDPIKTGNSMWIFYQCPAEKCQNVFTAQFRQEFHSSKYHPHTHNGFDLVAIFPQSIQSQEWAEEVQALSPDFEKIYNQALHAETINLSHICGPGYRKALEFLVKDYCISETPAEEAEIKKMQLAPCIKKYISDTRAQKVIERAAWLGNDETHYERRWTTKDVQDLKLLIRLVVNYVENQKLTERYMADMPEGKK